MNRPTPLFQCRQPGCSAEMVPKTIWCAEHRFPRPRGDGQCLATSCSNPVTEGDSPWCWQHTRANEQSEELSYLRLLVERAAFVSEHLMQMIDRETWRASGGDDGQGHYEGDYREEQTHAEIQRWKEIVGA